MAAGNTFEEAVSHGICEVVERHIQTVVQENKLVTSTINQKSIRSAIVQDLLDKFKAINQKVILKDLSLGIGIPIIGVVRKADIGRYFITVGVAPNREEAIIRALIENSQVEPHVGSHIKHKEGWKKSSIKHYLQESKEINYSDLPNIHNIDIKNEINTLKSLLEKQGMKIYYIETTDPKLKIPSVLVYITKTKCFFEQVHHRNIIMGLIEESFKIKDYKQALKYIRRGERLDLRNIEYYRFYRGLVFAFRKKYKEAINIFEKLPKKRLYEFESIIDIHIGICHLALGNFDKTFEYFVNNIKRYLDTKFVFIRSYHRFDEEMFANAQEIYLTLQLKLHPLRTKKQ
jgi:ribosomal protein S12 methylthiotransferase accessory factor